MSYQNMGIYRTAFQLTVHIEQCVREFKKCDKYTTGSELRKMTTELLYKVATFNDLPKEGKYQFCFDLRQELNRFQIKMALCEELNVFRSYKSWFRASELLRDIVEQNEKLLKYFRQSHGGNALP